MWVSCEVRLKGVNQPVAQDESFPLRISVDEVVPLLNEEVFCSTSTRILGLGSLQYQPSLVWDGSLFCLSRNRIRSSSYLWYFHGSEVELDCKCHTMKSGLYDEMLMFLSCFLSGAYLDLWHFTASIYFSLSAFGDVASMDLWSRNITSVARSFSSFQRPVFDYKENKCSCSLAKCWGKTWFLLKCL